MKRLALALVVTVLLSLSIAADDGQIPIGGKTGCQPPTQCKSIAAPPATVDQKTVDVGTIIILAVLNTIRGM